MELLKKETLFLSKVENTEITTQDIETSLANASESAKLYSKSHSQYAWKNLTENYYGDSRCIRQISAELIRKKHALTENKFKILKKKARLDEKIATKSKSPLLELEILELEESALNLESAYAGALKDITTLSAMYEQIKAKIIAEYGVFDEETLEKDEKKYWIRRFVAQSLRDIRTTGIIGIGNQEQLANINLNVQTVTKFCKEYLAQENANASAEVISNKLERTFLDAMADRCKDSTDEFNIEKGFNPDIETKFLTIYK